MSLLRSWNPTGGVLGTKKTIRITVDLSQEMYDLLGRLEESTDAHSKAEVVRKAIKFYEYLVTKNADGYEFSLKRGDQAERVVFPLLGGP